MEEVTLQAVKRAMPGHGRARMHSSLLTTLGIADNDEVEVVASGGTSLTLTVFAASLVEKNQIRISEDDLKKLGAGSGDDVRVRRKIPVTEQVRTAAEDIADRVGKGVKGIGDKVSEKTAGIAEETRQAAQEISAKAKEVSSRVADEARPIGEKISGAGRDTAARISELVPTARFNAAVEAGVKQLSQADAADLKQRLAKAGGEIHVVTVAAAAGRTIRNLTVPPEVTIVALQRSDNSLTTIAADTLLQSGDRVYMAGDVKELDYMTTVLEG